MTKNRVTLYSSFSIHFLLLSYKKTVVAMNSMKTKLYSLLLILTSLLGYLEWGDNHSFLFEIEGQLLLDIPSNPESLFHPFILLPLTGQILLFITLFQKEPRKSLIYLGMAGIGVLMVFLFFIGILVTNMKILSSSLPYLIICGLTIWHLTKSKPSDE